MAIEENYISKKLQQFLSQKNCCLKFSCLLRSTERYILINFASELKLKIRILSSDGLKVVKVHKPTCVHHIDQPPSINLTQKSIKYYLQFYKTSNLSKNGTQTMPLLFTSQISRAVAPAHRFSFLEISARKTIEVDLNKLHIFTKNDREIRPEKSKILELVNQNRISIIKGAKSTFISLLLIENCFMKKSYCKIICIELYELLAINNCEKLSEYLQEKVGETVAFQVHLQSRISQKSNIIYTTARFMLRVLMGQNSIESLKNFSHVIISDIHLHHSLTDILLYELKKAFQFHSDLKIIMLSDSSHNKEFLSYFKEGQEMQTLSNMNHVNVYYLEDCQVLTKKEKSVHLSCDEFFPPNFNNFYSKCVRKQEKDFIDLELIGIIIQLLTIKWKRGNILIFLPNYEYLVRLNFTILKNKLTGNLPQDICIFLLHEDIQLEQLNSILGKTRKTIKIILSTEIAENLECLLDITYIIDSARVQRKFYESANECGNNSLEYTSLECLDRRSKLSGRSSSCGYCFRLIPKYLIEHISKVHTPDLAIIPLDKICLTVRMLSKHESISEYFGNLIVRPPSKHILLAIDMLKKIDVLDSMENATWLGCRLMDVPIEAHLGKLLIYAIVLQCLDPILTIVSFLSFTDLEIPSGNNFTLAALNQTNKKERKLLSNTFFSDHLLYLRIYQNWQNNRQENNPEKLLANEDNYVFNSIMHKISDIRMKLVGSLRSSQLIHNQGQLSMHNLNLKSDNWSVIKAAFVGGSYPRFSMIDTVGCELKSGQNIKLMLHPNSILKELNIESVNQSKLPSKWIVYSKEQKYFQRNSISYCTLISPLTMFLFAGQFKIRPFNIKYTGYKLFTSKRYQIYLDNWISVEIELPETKNLLKLRQQFFIIFEDFLQNCTNTDKFRKPPRKSNQRLLETIHEILVQEDFACGFLHPENVGIRPKASPHKMNENLF